MVEWFDRHLRNGPVVIRTTDDSGVETFTTTGEEAAR
jgi:hypothetical protein